MSGRKILFLEFNELCPAILDRLIDAGRLPHFQRLRDSSQVFTGIADVQEQENLEPWIQWYSQHTGLSYYQHGVFHLTDGPKAGHGDIWQFLRRAGYQVGNFAGMNSAAMTGPGCFYLPDPWCNTESAYPPELNAFQRVISSKVQENSNGSAPPSRKDYIELLRFLVTHGLSSRSVMALLQQLATEAFSRDEGWRRATLLDKLQRDVFLYYWRRNKPDYASIFVNSVAHFQHSYFHLFEPEAFDLPPDQMNDPAHRDAVLYGYSQMDALLGDFLQLEREGVMICLSTALSQKPNPEAGKVFYRPRRIEELLGLVHVRPLRTLPVMAQQFSLEFASSEEAEQARAQLATITLDGRQVMDFCPAPERHLFVDNGLRRVIPPGAKLRIGNQEFDYHEIFYRITTTKSGAHHPESVLWFGTGTHRHHEGHMPILNVLPTLLDYYRVDLLPEEAALRSGTSFFDLLGIERYEENVQLAA